jgi:hypothetical protein
MMDGSEGHDIVMPLDAVSAPAKGLRPLALGGHDGQRWPHRPAGSVSSVSGC